LSCGRKRFLTCRDDSVLHYNTAAIEAAFIDAPISGAVH